MYTHVSPTPPPQKKSHIDLKLNNLFQTPSINSGSKTDFTCNHTMTFQQLQPAHLTKRLGHINFKACC